MNNLHLTDINLYAVVVAWIIHTASGLLWFQPRLFGNEWVFPVSSWVHGNELIILHIIPKQEKCEYDRNDIANKP